MMPIFEQPEPGDTLLDTAVKNSSANERVGLAEDASPILESLQLHMTRVVAALPEQIRQPADLRRVLQIDKALSWNVYRMVTAADSLAACAFVPGVGMMRRFLQCANDAGVPIDTTAAAAAAFSAFETLVKRHAQDRAAFTSIIRDLHGEETGKDDIKHKRAAYRASRHLHGVHADAVVQSLMFHPGVGGQGMDIAIIRGDVGIQQSRARTTLLHELVFRFGKLGETEGRLPQAIDPDPASAPSPFPLLRPFCSEPLPEFRRIEDSANRLVTQVHSRHLGSEGAATYFFGTILRDMVPLTFPDRPFRTWRSVMSIPARVFQRDVWLHECVWPSTLKLSVGLYWLRNLDMETPLRETDQMPLDEQLQEIDGAAKTGYNPEVPRYSEMMRYAADRLGWKLDEFRLFRCRIEYPVVGSIVQITFPTGVDDVPADRPT